jgi:hypothetical protein
MSGNIDILLRLPDVVTIGRSQLQDYCNEWLARPIACEHGISHLIVGSDLMLTVNLDADRVEFVDNRFYIPICELLDYIIDQQFHEPAKRVRTWSPTRFVDAEIVRRRTMLIDGDAKRVTGVNSTDEELQAAIEVISQVDSHLYEMWNIKPLSLISGNGAQLLYRIDEPADTLLVGQVLAHLHGRFSTDKVTIDTGVSDAARITRLPGTLNMKGDDVPGRPRRYARIQSIPDEKRTVTTEQLEMLAVPQTCTSVSVPGTLSKGQAQYASAPGDWTHERLRDFLDNEFKGAYREVVDGNKNYDSDIAYDLETCPFNDHGDEKWKSRIGLINGKPGFKCDSSGLSDSGGACVYAAITGA